MLVAVVLAVQPPTPTQPRPVVATSDVAAPQLDAIGDIVGSPPVDAQSVPSAAAAAPPPDADLRLHGPAVASEIAAAGGSISGTVVADGSGSPLAGICATGFPTSGATGTSSAPSASDGTYFIAGLAPGSYRVKLSDCVGSIDYASEYYNNTLDFNSAAIVTVTDGATTSGINASMAIGGRISGTVVADATGAPLPGICVSATLVSSSSSIARPTTAADGTYTIAGLAVGSYRVRFSDCVGNVDYASEYYNNTLDFSAATIVTVIAGATTSGINAGMAAGGSISGTIVADGSGSPLAGMCAGVFPTSGATGTSNVSSPPTASDGTYVIAGIAVGSYRVRFNDCVGSVDYATEYYDNTQDFNAATLVSVTAGATTPGIDASLAIAGRISGTVVADATGAPLAGICVSANLASGGTSFSRPVTAADGTYTYSGLAPGSYKVKFDDCVGTVEYATEYYNNKPDFGSADVVTVTAGATTSGINAGMAAGGSISGTIVADADGAPLAGMCASASPSAGGNGISSAPTASNGTYTIAGLAVGSYRVRFNDCVGSVDYATEYYDNTQNSMSATAVSVTAGATTSGINASLAVAGRISGTVVADATGAPLADICVSAFPASGGTSFSRPVTAADGIYTYAGLAPGSYKVKFEDCVGTVDYATEYYNNKPDFSSADVVTVAAGATTSGINAGMAATVAPAIAGSTWHISGSQSPTIFAGGTVSAYAVGAFQNVPYLMVLTTGGNCANVAATLNPSTRFANSSGFISRTVGTVPAGTIPGSYQICFRTSDGTTATGGVNLSVVPVG